MNDTDIIWFKRAMQGAIVLLLTGHFADVELDGHSAQRGVSVFEAVVRSVVDDQLRESVDIRVDPRELEVVSPYVFEPHADRIASEKSEDRSMILRRLSIPEGDAVAAMECFLGADPDVLPPDAVSKITASCSDFGPYSVLVTSPTEYDDDGQSATRYGVEVSVSPALGTWEATRYSLRWAADRNGWRIVDQQMKAAAN